MLLVSSSRKPLRCWLSVLFALPRDDRQYGWKNEVLGGGSCVSLLVCRLRIQRRMANSARREQTPRITHMAMIAPLFMPRVALEPVDAPAVEVPVAEDDVDVGL